MAYQTPITIASAISKIKDREYILPAIQREFVWSAEQIEMLFDSLMRDYPISTFLFWKVKKEKVADFQFYEFVREYHQKKNPHNPKAVLSENQDRTAVLDGQQRLTSLYIALAGYLARKAPYYKWDSPNAFPKKKLYLNLLDPAEDIERDYEFKFLKPDNAAADTNKFWFECSEIMSIDAPKKLGKYLVKHGLSDSSKYSAKQIEFASDTLYEFFDVVHKKMVISFFEETSNELDKVLQIFIRINSGGTKLSYSDLLLSIATAQWTERDAREVVHEFVDDINKIGGGFAFDKDNVLKACLVLMDLDVKFKVDNFKKANMDKIDKHWDAISLAMESAVRLLHKLGYNRDNFGATNAVIPVAYFIFKNDFEVTIVNHASREEDRKAIREWLARVLLKGTFGGQPDSIYPKMRELINKHLGRFPLKEIIDNYAGQRKSISFTEEDIENLLEREYGKRGTYSALTLLYPGLDSSFNYHQDHIHPKSAFHKKRLKKAGLDAEEIEYFQDWFNTLANLQLMQDTDNIQKNDKPFKQWLESKYPSQADQKAYLLQHYIPSDVSLELTDFREFLDSRWDTLKQKFMVILDATTSNEEE